MEDRIFTSIHFEYRFQIFHGTEYISRKYSTFAIHRSDDLLYRSNGYFRFNSFRRSWNLEIEIVHRRGDYRGIGLPNACTDSETREREREKYSEGLRSERPETVASSRSFSFSVRVSALPLSSSFARAFIRHGGLSRKRSMRSVVCRNNRPIARENPRRWDKIAFRRVDDGASSRNRRSFSRKKKKKRTIIILR